MNVSLYLGLRSPGKHAVPQWGRSYDHCKYAVLVGLVGKDLACWCPLDQPCHADVLLEIANGGDPW